MTRSSAWSVNGREARPTRPNFAEWEVELTPPSDRRLAEDEAGNVEKTPMLSSWNPALPLEGAAASFDRTPAAHIVRTSSTGSRLTRFVGWGSADEVGATHQGMERRVAR